MVSSVFPKHSGREFQVFTTPLLYWVVSNLGFQAWKISGFHFNKLPLSLGQDSLPKTIPFTHVILSSVVFSVPLTDSGSEDK